MSQTFLCTSFCFVVFHPSTSFWRILWVVASALGWENFSDILRKRRWSCYIILFSSNCLEYKFTKFENHNFLLLYMLDVVWSVAWIEEILVTSGFFYILSWTLVVVLRALVSDGVSISSLLLDKFMFLIVSEVRIVDIQDPWFLKGWNESLLDKFLAQAFVVHERTTSSGEFIHKKQWKICMYTCNYDT